MRVLGIDPGKGELNVCLLHVRGSRAQVARTERVVLPLLAVSDLHDTSVVKKLKGTVRSLFRSTSPDLVVVERMMTRPGKGAPVEVINVALGFLTCLAPASLPLRYVTAAAWKNWVRRTYGEPEHYRSCQNCRREATCEDRPKTNCLLWKEKEPWQKLALEEVLHYPFPTVHEADAAGLALYGARVLVD